LRRRSRTATTPGHRTLASGSTENILKISGGDRRVDPRRSLAVQSICADLRRGCRAPFVLQKLKVK